MAKVEREEGCASCCVKKKGNDRHFFPPSANKDYDISWDSVWLCEIDTLDGEGISPSGCYRNLNNGSSIDLLFRLLCD
jgi:hypothetical protein